MKILLTGSRGFIGTYFIEKYKRKYSIDTFSFQKDKLSGVELSSIETIIHLSALVHQIGGASKEEYYKINVAQTISLAKKAKNECVKHFIFMSTIKVYGEETDLIYKENTICKPKDDYGKSKLQAENELKELEATDFKVSIIRTPIVYGYGVKANIKNLLSLVNKVSVLPFADIDNNRSMVYIGNLCHMIDLICEKKEDGIFLACDDRAISTPVLIKLIAKLMGKKVYLVKIPFLSGIIKILKPNIYNRLFKSLEVNNNKSKNILDFKNLYTKEQGIKYMIEGE